jgi:hypothetical protein
MSSSRKRSRAGSTVSVGDGSTFLAPARASPRSFPEPRVAMHARGLATELAAWSPRRWLVAAGTALAVALATGLPTDVVPNPFYVRMTPVVWWNYPIWAVAAILAGLVAATYVRAARTAKHHRQAGTAFGGSVLSFFAVGCPICNKLVVAALGSSGALSYFGPAQPAIGLASIGLLATALAFRVRAAACSVRPTSPSLRARRG